MNAANSALAVQPRQALTPTTSAPLSINLAEANALGGAVDRFLARDDISATFYLGTNGPTASLPDSPVARLDLLKRLPAAAQCWKLETMIEEELARPIRPADIAATIRPLIAAWPNASKLAPEFHAALVAIVGEEAVTARWPRAAIVGGLVRLLKTATFVPSVAEVIEAIREEKSRLYGAALLAGKVAETICQIEDRLIASGHLDPEAAE